MSPTTRPRSPPSAPLQSSTGPNAPVSWDSTIEFLRGLPISNQKILLRGTEIGRFVHVYLSAETLAHISYLHDAYPDAEYPR